MSRLLADCWKPPSPPPRPFPRTLTSCPGGSKRSRSASVDTVKSFVLFTAADRRMCLSSWEEPICERDLLKRFV